MTIVGISGEKSAQGLPRQLGRRYPPAHSGSLCAATGCAWDCDSDSGTFWRSHAGRHFLVRIATRWRDTGVLARTRTRTKAFSQNVKAPDLSDHVPYGHAREAPLPAKPSPTSLSTGSPSASAHRAVRLERAREGSMCFREGRPGAQTKEWRHPGSMDVLFQIREEILHGESPCDERETGPDTA